MTFLSTVAVCRLCSPNGCLTKPLLTGDGGATEGRDGEIAAERRERMDEGTHIGWRSALMAPVCFVIRSSVGGVKEKQAERKKEDRRPDRMDPE